jgi:aspartate/methionine/tyrosine aminotransferase
MRHIAKYIMDTSGGERAKFMTAKTPAGLIRLDSGSPSFATPPHIVDAVKKAIDDGHTGYILEKGVMALLEAVSAQLFAETGATVSPSQVLVTNGSSSGIYSVMSCFLDPGDEVIVFDPSYSLYAHVARQLGAVPVPVRLSADYQLDIAAVRAAVTPRTRLVMLCNPNNPTGSVFREADIAALLDLCAERDLLLASDEAYCKLMQPGQVHVPVLKFHRHLDRLILLGTFSKSYAMTGWRLGYLVAPPDLIDYLYGIHRAINGPICNFVQRAGIAALRGPQDCIGEFNAIYHRRAALMHRLAAAIPGLFPAQPQGAFYMWTRFELPQSAKDVRARLFERGVAVRSGSEYGAGGEKHLRISYSVSEETIEKGMATVAEVVGALAKEAP